MQVDTRRINQHLDVIHSGIDAFQASWNRRHHGERPDSSHLRRAYQAARALVLQAEELTRVFGEKAFVQQTRRLERNLLAMINRLAEGQYQRNPPMFVQADINGLRRQFERVNTLIRAEDIVLRGGVDKSRSSSVARSRLSTM